MQKQTLIWFFSEKLSRDDKKKKKIVSHLLSDGTEMQLWIKLLVNIADYNMFCSNYIIMLQIGLSALSLHCDRSKIKSAIGIIVCCSKTGFPSVEFTTCLIYFYNNYKIQEIDNSRNPQ